MNGTDGPRPLVPARPRDGAPVALDVAQAPLDLVVVRAIRVPGVPEFGMTDVAALIDAAAEATKEAGFAQTGTVPDRRPTYSEFQE